MLGELDHIEGRGPRWRFAAGCAGAALLLPPWGRAAAAVWTMVVAAAGAAGIYASVAVRYRLGTGDWVFAVMRCSAPADHQGPRAGPSARTSATGSATT